MRLAAEGVGEFDEAAVDAGVLVGGVVVGVVLDDVLEARGAVGCVEVLEAATELEGES